MKRIVMRVKGGVISTLYTEDINLKAFGSAMTVTRASNVEFDNHRGGWTVQLADGMYLAGLPPAADGISGYVTGMLGLAEVFPTRDAALAAEVEFLQRKLAGV